MDRDRDDYSGRFTREFELEDFTNALREVSPATTADVAEEVGCSRDLAYRRLKELNETGQVDGDLVGGSYQWRLRGGNRED